MKYKPEVLKMVTRAPARRGKGEQLPLAFQAFKIIVSKLNIPKS
jgi:hypothetical protein